MLQEQFASNPERKRTKMHSAYFIATHERRLQDTRKFNSEAELGLRGSIQQQNPKFLLAAINASFSHQ